MAQDSCTVCLVRRRSGSSKREALRGPLPDRRVFYAEFGDVERLVNEIAPAAEATIGVTPITIEIGAFMACAERGYAASYGQDQRVAACRLWANQARVPGTKERSEPNRSFRRSSMRALLPASVKSSLLLLPSVPDGGVQEPTVNQTSDRL